MISIPEALIKPSEPYGNNRMDNINGDLILFPNQKISDPNGNVFEIQKWLGAGQFGQVYKCVQCHAGEQTNRQFAIKISKSTTEAHCQFQYEIQALLWLKTYLSAKDLSRISVIESGFSYLNHFCIVIELLGPSVLDEIVQHKYKGLSLKYVQSVLKSVLPVLYTLSTYNLIHLDVKPENILQAYPKSMEQFKLIDFGSCLFVGDCIDVQYVQSRFYRAPEVLLRLPYDSKVDVWSIGCLAAELMLGLPLMPAQTELHLATLIAQTIGQFPKEMVISSPRYIQLFMPDGTLKSQQLLCEENGEDFVTTFQPYFVHQKLEDIIMSYEPDEDKHNDIENRKVFLDLLKGLLQLDPKKRISAEEALNHPFMKIDFGED